MEPLLLGLLEPELPAFLPATVMGDGPSQAVAQSHPKCKSSSPDTLQSLLNPPVTWIAVARAHRPHGASRSMAQC
jgi:hypothetical protein